MGEGITGLAAKSGELQIGAPAYEDADLSKAAGDVRHVAAGYRSSGATGCWERRR